MRDNRTFNRRQFLALTGAAGVLGVAGCAGDGGDGGGGSDGSSGGGGSSDGGSDGDSDGSSGDGGSDGGSTSGGGGASLTIGGVYPLSGNLGAATQRNQAMVARSMDDFIANSHPEFAPMALAEGEGFSNLDSVEIKWADHRGEPSAGRSEAERLIQSEGVDVLMGSVYSSVTKTIQQVTEREGVPYVNGASTAPGLTADDRNTSWFWRTGPHERILQQTLFDFVDRINSERDAGIESVGIIHEDTEFGSTTKDVQLELADERGLEVVAGPFSYSAKQVTSFNSEINNMRNAEPDLFLHTGFLQDTLLLNRNMRDLDWFPSMYYGSGGYNQTDYFAANPELSNFVTARSNYSPALEESEPVFGKVNEYFKQNVEAFNGYSIRMWGSWMSTLAALDELGSSDPGEIQGKLDSLDVPAVDSTMPYGVQFDENGQNQKTAPLLLQFEGGSSNLIYPSSVAQTDAVYPAPGWSER
jgi:branched-chain amino acid transport system substrate-binding protein